MRSHWLYILLCAAMFVACDDKSASDPLVSPPPFLETETFDELPECTDQWDGAEAYVVENAATYVCVDKKWIKEGNSSAVSSSSSSAKSSSSVTPQSSDSETSVSSSSAKSSSSSAKSSSSVKPESSSSETSESSSSVSIFNPKISYGEMTDSRDSHTYRTVKIGNQVWMAENLNYESANSYESMYGRLYTWSAALESCPSGWHLPSWAEWDTLITVVGKGNGYAGMKLKSGADWVHETDFNSEVYESSNESGFSALPAGGKTADLYEGRSGQAAFFWNSSEFTDNDAYTTNLYYDDTNVSWKRVSKEYAYSVRCLQGEKQSSPSSESPFNPNAEYGELTDSRDGQTYKTVEIGDQVWMAENLNFETESSYCYNDSAKFCKKYGRLYWWADAVGKSEEECGYGKTCSLPSGNIQGVCPDGWHLPSYTEWDALLTAVGGKSKAGTALKSAFGWYGGYPSYSGIYGANESGFSALPGGHMFGSRDNPAFDDDMDVSNAHFWSSTEENGEVYDMNLDKDLNSAGLLADEDSKAFGFSVRCVKN
ncbi:MAG: fibrobacter succinogenes major paralogous domain-containing protein [Fibrobacter sp.]|uniref:fibrobacter succinogenes major paralogous domain-containing protein n=1 Tax=Fibrobacter sp. TaxID=35828 RepID=UPI0025BDA06C|nr:fibrobacter succinogenes major paralogous domain-containing protein [Fibrobacter sp.]MBR4785923.1 fibrobacter succinogenes major paralogous domain-containing protein [Fibrobacter sp.]